MKRNLLVYIFLLGIFPVHAQSQMHGWHIHYAYSTVTNVELSTDKVYALSGGALFSVNKQEGNIEYYNKLTGLNSTGIAQIRYDKAGKRLIILYQDGNIDLLHDNRTIYNIPDLYNTQLSINKNANCIFLSEKKAYIGMDFGIIVLNLERKEIADTYYIGPNAAEVSVHSITIKGDTLYAASDKAVYAANMNDNLVDYAFWKDVQSLPGTGNIQDLVNYHDQLCLLRDSALYVLNGQVWSQRLSDKKIYHLKTEDDRLYGLSAEGTYDIAPNFSYRHIGLFYGSADVCFDPVARTYWFATLYQGVGTYDTRTDTYDTYTPNGPETNTAYRIRISDNKVFVVPGGYMAVFCYRQGCVMTYENNKWTNYSQPYMTEHIGIATTDYCDIAIHPADPSHFFVASFGFGLIEFRNNEYYTRYTPSNSLLQPVISNHPEQYTWVDGLTFDNEGNLWMLNTDVATVKVLTPAGTWYVIANEATRRTDPNRTKDLLISNRNPNLKILTCARRAAGIGVFNDNGTIANQQDDKAAFHSSFVDQDGKSLVPEFIYSVAQDNNGALWVGTNAGLMTFDNPETLLTSNACRRIIIPRNDGTNLADYLLDNEQINALAVDGANRKWIGTETSGLYLMSEDGIETIEHFTAENSPLPSNQIMSIAINHNTGEVFVGTGGGLISYQSDAAVAHDDFSQIYAYPNPVRENFQGVITVAGLMENSVVKFTDNAGNLLCETRSNGGLAIWDGKDAYGRRVHSGVYYALCNSENGEQYAMTKILIIN